MTTKQYDPNWPFPQFDEDGVQLFPGYMDGLQPIVKPDPYDYFKSFEEEFGEAPW